MRCYKNILASHTKDRRAWCHFIFMLFLFIFLLWYENICLALRALHIFNNWPSLCIFRCCSQLVLWSPLNQWLLILGATILIRDLHVLISIYCSTILTRNKCLCVTFHNIANQKWTRIIFERVEPNRKEQNKWNLMSSAV